MNHLATDDAAQPSGHPGTALTEVEIRFRKAVSEHEMTVVNEIGMFRHLTFKNPKSFNYHFHITTWPGYLAISGDTGCYVFSRLPDMFNFFRGEGINAQYWAEKLQAVDRNGGVKEFSDAMFHEAIKRDFAEWSFDSEGDRAKAWQAIQESDLADDSAPESIEDAVQAAMDYRCPVSKTRFNDFWDHQLQDYTFRFLWCCHAIQWAVEKYDAAQTSVAPGTLPAHG
jgi:hypothetical protein